MASPTRTTSCGCRALSSLADYLVREIQDVYRLQGVKINDKHIEVIIRQMLRKVNVTVAGDSELPARRADRQGPVLEVMPSSSRRRARTPLTVEPCCSVSPRHRWRRSRSSPPPVVPGDHARVLTEAAVRGLKDELRGLKENVIVGRLIPAGTGFAHHAERRRTARAGLRRSAQRARRGPQAELSEAEAEQHRRRRG